jgi:sec-independent protein translocase protein TatC
MSLRDHLSELRSRLIKALLFVFLGAIVGWILYPQILDLLKEPYCQLPADRRFNPSGLTSANECQLAFFGPLDGFVLRLKVGVICGIILSSPFWLYQLWSFVTPGLRRHERRWSLVFVFCATLLFLAGAVISYFTYRQGAEPAGQPGRQRHGRGPGGAELRQLRDLDAARLRRGVRAAAAVSMLNLVGVLPRPA